MKSKKTWFVVMPAILALFVGAVICGVTLPMPGCILLAGAWGALVGGSAKHFYVYLDNRGVFDDEK